MSMRHPREVGQEHVLERYVTPGQRYLGLLHGNFFRLDGSEQSDFVEALASDAASVTVEELSALFGYEWRSRLTASWLAGVARRTEWRSLIGQLLLASELTYAGQGFCFALARFGTTEDAQILTEYLARYLPQLDRRYDQPLALGALLRLDSLLGTDYAQRFTAVDGPWDRWAEALPHLRGNPAWTADAQRHSLDAWCEWPWPDAPLAAEFGDSGSLG
ncbi:DUF6000 family protein [Kitasatospora sp. NPDC001603]|uniref:DUF6000 family protein n=1 Tax=Kitasatospora sp. NPDC001603 TaxID=3154388 RepID=UPI003327D0CF